MSLNSTPSASRVHIGIFGRSNVGKSSLINALTGQELAIVSPLAGTTTDPVSKAMELLPLGPVVIIDTPGLDDTSPLGRARVAKATEKLAGVDLALLVADATAGLGACEQELAAKLNARDVPYLTVFNKSDLLAARPQDTPSEKWVSAATGAGIHALRDAMAALRPREAHAAPIVADLLAAGDIVVLVTPIDGSAPKGRLILPQQQTIRDILDANAQALVTQETGLSGALAALAARPRLVITDSQVFGPVAKMLPQEVPLTSFSILMARHKGVLRPSAEGLLAVPRLEAGSRVLVAEGCTHHRQCQDIGTVKIPRWLGQKTGKALDFSFVSGGDFPADLTPYSLVVHCGGCMLQPRVVQQRMARAAEQGVPMTNYGMLIAYVNGILRRSLGPFEEYADILGQI